MQINQLIIELKMYSKQWFSDVTQLLNNNKNNLTKEWVSMILKFRTFRKMTVLN